MRKLSLASLNKKDEARGESPCCPEALLRWSKPCNARYCEHCGTWRDAPKVAPTAWGPTWKTGDDGKFVRPEHTLGPQVAAWVKKYVKSPDGDGMWRFTPEQLRLLYWIYAIRPESTRNATSWIFRELNIQRLKGW